LETFEKTVFKKMVQDPVFLPKMAAALDSLYTSEWNSE
jgi:hypothetical protein